jgi:hypothetical protein
MKIKGKKYRMVLGETNDEKFIIEKQIRLLFRKKWSRKYLNGDIKYYYSDNRNSARKIVNILNGYDHLVDQ